MSTYLPIYLARHPYPPEEHLSRLFAFCHSSAFFGNLCPSPALDSALSDLYSLEVSPLQMVLDLESPEVMVPVEESLYRLESTLVDSSHLFIFSQRHRSLLAQVSAI